MSRQTAILTKPTSNNVKVDLAVGGVSGRFENYHFINPDDNETLSFTPVEGYICCGDLYDCEDCQEGEICRTAKISRCGEKQFETVQGQVFTLGEPDHSLIEYIAILGGNTSLAATHR